MEPAYQVEDFEEYESFFNKHFRNNVCNKSVKSKKNIVSNPEHSFIHQFVDNLNYICSEKEEVCDMYCLFSILRPYKHITDYLTYQIRGYPYHVVYLYLKFLLLDVERKQLIENYLNRVSNILNYIKYQRKTINFLDDGIDRFDFPEEDKICLEEIMKEIYFIMNEDILMDFLDPYDAFKNYRRLDITKSENIEYRIDHYGNTNFLDKIRIPLLYSSNIIFLYNFNYYISNTPEYQSMCDDGETSINGLEDFLRRYRKNTDKFIKIYNFLYNFKYFQRNKDDIELFNRQYDNLPINSIVIIDNTRRFCQTVIEINSLTNQDLFRYSVVTQLFKELFDVHMCENSSFYLYFDLLLNNTFKYKQRYPNDDYKMSFYIRPEKCIDTIFHQKYKSYFKSKLYNSLTFINNVYLKSLKEQSVQELKEFLEKVLITHHYHKSVKY